MQAITLINLCAREYNDVSFTRIRKDATAGTNPANWLDYLNDAQRALMIVRPDANAVTESVKLVAGTRQTLPNDSLRLLDVSRNMGIDGTVVGNTIRLAERDAQDMVRRDWHKKTGVVIRDVYYNDKKDPDVFWVSPAVPSTPDVYIEITTSKMPTEVSDADTDAIGVSDIYATAMQQWMLYRAYALATQALNQWQRAQFYFSSFFNVLGVKMRNDMWNSPNTPDILPPMEAISGSR